MARIGQRRCGMYSQRVRNISPSPREYISRPLTHDAHNLILVILRTSQLCRFRTVNWPLLLIFEISRVLSRFVALLLLLALIVAVIVSCCQLPLTSTSASDSDCISCCTSSCCTPPVVLVVALLFAGGYASGGDSASSSRSSSLSFVVLIAVLALAAKSVKSDWWCLRHFVWCAYVNYLIVRQLQFPGREIYSRGPGDIFLTQSETGSVVNKMEVCVATSLHFTSDSCLRESTRRG